jgi:hypothetical protein
VVKVTRKFTPLTIEVTDEADLNMIYKILDTAYYKSDYLGRQKEPSEMQLYIYELQRILHV